MFVCVRLLSGRGIDNEIFLSDGFAEGLMIFPVGKKKLSIGFVMFRRMLLFTDNMRLSKIDMQTLFSAKREIG